MVAERELTLKGVLRRKATYPGFLCLSWISKTPEITEITDDRLSTEERRFVHHVTLFSSQNDPRERHPLHLEMLSSEDDDDKIVSKILLKRN